MDPSAAKGLKRTVAKRISITGLFFGVDDPMAARLYQPAKTATSSGRAKTRFWILEMEPEDRKTVDPLCGWSGSGDTQQQIQLKFSSKDAALAYAKRNRIEVQLFSPHRRLVRPKAYADNFTRLP